MADELNSELDPETNDSPDWRDTTASNPAEETAVEPLADAADDPEVADDREVADDPIAGTDEVYLEEEPSRTPDAPAVVDDLYRARDDQAVAAAAASHASVRAEQERLQAERAARRDARLAALNPVPEPVAPATLVEGRAQATPAEPTIVERVTLVRSTDKFGGALGLFLIRLVVATILGVRGVGHLLDLAGTSALIATTVLPMPTILAIVLASAEAAVAVALVLGVLTRLAGAGVAAIAGSALGFVLWGAWSPFRPGEPGFTGELELLLVAVGLLLLFVGGGGWAVDRAFRKRRDADRLADA